MVNLSVKLNHSKLYGVSAGRIPPTLSIPKYWNATIYDNTAIVNKPAVPRIPANFCDILFPPNAKVRNMNKGNASIRIENE